MLDAPARHPAPPRTATRRAAIVGVGSALPETVVANAPIAARLGVDEGWILKRIGVHERRIVADGERLTDLAAAAGLRAIEHAGIDAAQLDLVLVGTLTQDELLPNAAPLVAAALGATDAGAADIGAACMGFLSGMTFGAAMIESGRAACVLVIGADALTRYVDHDDRNTAALIGDGAGAVVLGPAPGAGGIGTTVLRSDDRSREVVYMTRADAKLRMEGPRTFAVAVDRLCEVTREVLRAESIGLGDVDVFVYHQANARILRAVGQRLGLPADRVVDCIAGIGNTCAASVPLALADASARGLLRDGCTVLMAAIGAGFTWGAAIVRWHAPAT